MNKKDRQRLIRLILNTQEVERQKDFICLLENQGIYVTQATISRDIKDMQLVKVPSISGRYHYNLPVQKQLDAKTKLKRTLKDSYVSFSVQGKDTCLKVLPGNGPVVSSLIDQMKYDFVFGTVSDDNTVLTICKNDAGALDLKDEIECLLR